LSPVSIVCVFNDPEVRRNCLDRSIEEHRGEAPDVEYLPIDNVKGTFSSAGAALNFGAERASHDHVVFVHQDVYLHSLRALEEAAGRLASDGSLGVLGATGMSASGTLVGRLRDRVVLLGAPVRDPSDVDSLDEVLFMAPRDLLHREPLTQAPELAWHAYAVEYGMRARSMGLRVAATDIPLTHNSLTVNLDRLDVAHRAIADAYPDGLPVHTTCGTVRTTPRRLTDTPLLASHRWRYRWVRESVAVRPGRRAFGGRACVLSDIRRDIDDILSGLDDVLHIVNVDDSGAFGAGSGDLRLQRRGRPVVLSSGNAAAVATAVADRAPQSSMLVTNVDTSNLQVLAPALPAESLLGFHETIGYWILLGPAVAAAPARWQSPPAKPLGVPRLALP
jgi:hypothetical protein